MNARQNPLISSPPDPTLQACVVIPVLHDTARLERALNALANQTAGPHRPLRPDLFEVILLFSEFCPAGFSKRFQDRLPSCLRLHVAGPCCLDDPSQLRRAGMDEACRRLHRAGNPRGLLLSTEPDAEAARDWIAQNLAEIDAGADAVGGRVLLHPADAGSGNAAIGDLYAMDDRYRLLVAMLEDSCDPDPFDPLPRHYQHQFDSFALTAEAYAESGGLPVGSSGRATALYNALQELDLRVRHSPKVRVFTPRPWFDCSAGVVAQLGGCHLRPGEGERLPVESVEFLEAFFSARRCARRLWTFSRTRALLDAPFLGEVADLSGLPAHHIREFLSDTPTFGQFLSWLQLRKRIEAKWRNQGRFEPLALAITKLRQRFETPPGERRKFNFGVRSITVLSHL